MMPQSGVSTRNSSPTTADNPKVRLTSYVKPFTYTRLEYFAVRIGRSQTKWWVALFICLTTRAVHLELAFTLSMESGKMALLAVVLQMRYFRTEERTSSEPEKS